MKLLIRQAFDEVRNSLSSDRVLCDPDLNSAFLEKCRDLGLSENAVVLNWHLLNLRKSGELKDLGKSKPTSFRNESEYRFGSEIAARHMETKYGQSTDRILCDPQLASEFDTIAAEIVPGFSPLQYRWAALNLRKAKRLSPRFVSRIVTVETVQFGRFPDFDLAKVSERQGIYIFLSSREPLYVGETANLRKRIAKHSDHSDNKGLARWLWEHGITDVKLETRVLPEATTTLERRALEAELIKSMKPRFNLQRL